MRFVTGHGTQNDFVVLPDVDGTLDVTPDLVRRLCDRRTGIGADGVLRVVPTAKVPEAAGMDATWFMDYRNADGSVAEMCGNGIRVYARYLVEAGLATEGVLRLATRNGVRDVVVNNGLVTVDMGQAVVGEMLTVDGMPATAIDMGNPHAVVHVASVDELGELAPERTDLNVEYVEDVGPGHLRMRVHERGVGETQSCGTGACAAVVATVLRLAEPRGAAYVVDVPGGRLHVTWWEDGHVTLAGPAELGTEGEWTA